MLCPGYPYKLCFNHPSCFNRATALAMWGLVTPTCRAISVIDNPNSSTPRFAIPAGTDSPSSGGFLSSPKLGKNWTAGHKKIVTNEEIAFENENSTAGHA
jgi:hypothetical protein